MIEDPDSVPMILLKDSKIEIRWVKGKGQWWKFELHDTSATSKANWWHFELLTESLVWYPGNIIESNEVSSLCYSNIKIKCDTDQSRDSIIS